MWAPIVCTMLLGAAKVSYDVPVLARDVATDGRVDAAEWTGSREVRADGMRVRIGRRGEVLAIAVELEAPGISTLLLGSGDRVWVLHASAALGTGEYRCANGGVCTRTRDFDYRCRDSSPSPEAERCRADFRRGEGWIANVGPQGTRSREFLVDARRFGAEAQPLFLAVTGLTFPEKAGRWPTGDDDAGSLKIQQGLLSETGRFSPQTWWQIRR
jgi:hypothetical protein